MMFEKRVVRGSTYAAIPQQKHPEVQLKDTSKLAKSIKKVQQLQQENRPEYFDQEGVPPPKGRDNVEVQTDEFVETLTDKPPEYEKDTQTDFYIDRPVVRMFMPKKYGVEMETQIWDGDLFDFDYEVEAILQVLVGKTLEQSRMEVLEEEELKIMKQQQKHFEQLRNAELSEMQRLEAKERRLKEENDRRKLQHKKVKDQNVFSHQKLICRLITKNYMGKLKQASFNQLEDQGFFRNPLETSLYDQFLPWLYNQIESEIILKEEVKVGLTLFIQDSAAAALQVHKDNLNALNAKRNQIREEKRQKELERQEKLRRKEAEKKRKEEIERINKIRDQIIEKLASKGELRPNVLSQNIADIDGNQTNSQFGNNNLQKKVGVFGGVIGQVLIFAIAVNSISERGFSQDVAKLCSSPDAKFFNFVCENGSIEIGVNDQIDQKLAEINPDLSIATLSSATQDQTPHIISILKNSYEGVILNTIHQNAGAYGLPEDSIALMSEFVAKQFFANDSAQKKIKYVKQAHREAFSELGVAQMKPNLAELPISDKSERAQQIDENTGQPVPPASLAEAVVDDKATLFLPQGDDLKVLIQHQIAEMRIRQELLKILAADIKVIEGLEVPILIDVSEEADKLQGQLLEFIHQQLPIFNMNMY